MERINFAYDPYGMALLFPLINQIAIAMSETAEVVTVVNQHLINVNGESQAGDLKTASNHQLLTLVKNEQKCLQMWRPSCYK